MTIWPNDDYRTVLILRVIKMAGPSLAPLAPVARPESRRAEKECLTPSSPA